MTVLNMVFLHLFLLMSNCCLAAASHAGDRSLVQLSSDPIPSDLDEDMVSQHVKRLYEKYNKENRLKEGNTVRSFRAIQDSAGQKMMYHLNLSSLQDSEVILSATFHFFLDRHPHSKPWFCKRFKSPSCRSAAIHSPPSVSLIFRSVSSVSEARPGSQGSFFGNVTSHPHRTGVWQMKDVTQVIKEAWDKGQLLVSVELDVGRQHHKKGEDIISPASMPYLLVYADDQALSEPNSVAVSLQRYDPLSEGADFLQKPNTSPDVKGRVRRETNLLSDSIQNNELPEVDYWPDRYRKDDLWENDWHLALKPKLKYEKKENKVKTTGADEVDQLEEGHELQVLKKVVSTTQEVQTESSSGKRLENTRSEVSGKRQKNERRKEGKMGKKHKGNVNSQSPVLSFDEQTMRRARRRQSSAVQQKGCSRRTLRVDFADIGWSEWVIAPKAFDAYYCAGSCGFPMPQVMRPSNHATIQSIVRAVGIVPGVPEPCCIPDNMSPLAVLFQDESKNPVLKIYPNMTVQSCSCR